MAVHSPTLWLMQRSRWVWCIFLSRLPREAKWIPQPSCNSQTAMWFYASQNLLMPLVVISQTLTCSKASYIPLLVPEQLLWSRRSKAASTISPAAFGSPSSKDGLMCQGLPVNIFQGIPGTHKKLRYKVRGSGLPCGSVSLPFPSEWVGEGVAEGGNWN